LKAVVDKIDETGQNLEIDLNELVDTGLPRVNRNGAVLLTAARERIIAMSGTRPEPPATS
jgi:hypothetical protein